jgi:hypothetical protein
LQESGFQINALQLVSTAAGAGAVAVLFTPEFDTDLLLDHRLRFPGLRKKRPAG